MATIDSGGIEGEAIEVKTACAVGKFFSSVSLPGVQELNEAIRTWIMSRQGEIAAHWRS